MKQGIKHVKMPRRSRQWLGLGLLGLLLPLPKTMAQQVPQLDSTGRVVSTMPALVGDSVQVRLELQPDSLVAAPMSIDSARLQWLRTPPTWCATGWAASKPRCRTSSTIR
jgi:membrane-bound lytic murein transglycosylase D